MTDIDTVLPPGRTYEEVYRDFRWSVPARYNIAVDVCDRHAAREPGRLALIYEDEAGRVSQHSFGEFRARSNQLARALARLGVGRGDRVGIVLGQRPETPVAHLAAYKLGAVALPLSTLFGPEALQFRLENAGAQVVLTDAEGLERVLKAREALPGLAHVISADPVDADRVLDLGRLAAAEPDSLEPLDTAAEDPALLIYTSGTTGPPKGALHAHRVLIGHLPAIEFYHEPFPQPGDRLWSPADWAWAGGLLDILLPGWHYGVTVVAHRARRFDAERALDLLARHSVRNTLLMPTMLKMIRAAGGPRERAVRLRTIFTGGEPAGEEILRWTEQALGAMPNEGYGQTEMNLVLGNSAPLMPVKPGSMGRPVPGHVVEVVDEAGRPVPPGEVGEVAVRRPDPVMFLGYWGNPRATEEKFIGDWALSGDLARRDEDGYFWFLGRKDDVISSGGYRIGPGEIEDCLTAHPSVALAAAVGKPDPLRGEVVKAFVQLREGVGGSPELARELKAWVRERLSAHEYPREVEFIAALPTTTTGKVKRGDLRLLERSRLSGATPPGG